ncbi:hypothetical protein Gotri_025186, partial [Gossypium trilobum]|nr:hypothetical protein [Gossypium trilobum]
MLSHKFSENVLDATNKFEKLITNKKEIDGLPTTAIGLAAQRIVSNVLKLQLEKAKLLNYNNYAE